jgi:hypothetical protein
LKKSTCYEPFQVDRVWKNRRSQVVKGILNPRKASERAVLLENLVQEGRLPTHWYIHSLSVDVLLDSSLGHSPSLSEFSSSLEKISSSSLKISRTDTSSLTHARVYLRFLKRRGEILPPRESKLKALMRTYLEMAFASQEVQIIASRWQEEAEKTFANTLVFHTRPTRAV